MTAETVVERAARVLWEHDHPNNPWLTEEDYIVVNGSLVRGSRPTYLARAMVLQAHGLLADDEPQWLERDEPVPHPLSGRDRLARLIATAIADNAVLHFTWEDWGPASRHGFIAAADAVLADGYTKENDRG